MTRPRLSQTTWIAIVGVALLLAAAVLVAVVTDAHDALYPPAPTIPASTGGQP